MAEVYFLTRGIKRDVDYFVEHLDKCYFPIKFTVPMKDPMGNTTPVDTMMKVQGNLKPYQLWGYSIPEEYLQPLCNTLGIPGKETWFDKKPGEQTGSFMSGFGVKGILEGLRFALGAEKLPELDMTKGILQQPVYKSNINILGIGWRKDEFGKDSLGMTHELM